MYLIVIISEVFEETFKTKGPASGVTLHVDAGKMIEQSQHSHSESIGVIGIGAALGTVFGPIGTAVGGALGGLLCIFICKHGTTLK